MYEGEMIWRDVDRYFIDRLVEEDEALASARTSSARTVMPEADVAPNQGAFLSIIAQIAGARRVLEFGTLAGYSTIWLARAVGAAGTVTTLELDDATAAVARENFERAGVAERIELIVGPATESVQALIDAGTAPYDLVFIDADKPNNPLYLDAALKLSHPGTVIIGDNVVRNGAISDPNSDDPRVHGTWALIDRLGRQSNIAATALQTVGLKGWDGFTIGVVTDRTATVLEAQQPTDYLGADSIIEADHPDVIALGTKLREAHPSDYAFARAAFEWVRDTIAHAYDAQDHRVTLTATEVLNAGVGLCYAKSHLLAAILRSQGVPTGLCYQRLGSLEDGYVVHGLVAVHLDGSWHRQDPRGNKPGVDAQFSLTTERLAFDIDADAGELDYPTLYVSTATEVVTAITAAGDILEARLPSDLRIH